MIEKMIFAEEIKGHLDYLILSDGRVWSKRRKIFLSLNDNGTGGEYFPGGIT